MSDNWRTLDDDELVRIVSAGQAEMARRARHQVVLAEVDLVLADQREDAPGDPWSQPDGTPATAYPTGWITTHLEHQWESLVPWNVTEPAEGCEWWRDLGVTPVLEDPHGTDQ